MSNTSENPEFKCILIGAGIMSATLGIFLKKLMPFAKIEIYERLDKVAAESSNAWNNAGTGHSAFCELNYTPLNANGEIDVTKALHIAESFEISKQFWAYLVENDLIQSKTPFINDIDHMSFVWGDENVEFLRKRFEAMQEFSLFKEMEFSTDREQIKKWIPLIIEGRNPEEKIAATRMEAGTDVNFGDLTSGMIAYLNSKEGVEIHLGVEVENMKLNEEGRWDIKMKRMHEHDKFHVTADFVFIGAGGGAVSLLEKANIPEAFGYGGFPVSGEFLQCHNQEIIERHQAKVYGLAEVGSPPMSVPHLDTRFIDGKQTLLFGPYAGFSTKFLKNGSYFDLPLSIDSHNIWPLISAGFKNMELTKYLIKEVTQSQNERIESLKKYYPEAKSEDWTLTKAGQRVQIIKPNIHGKGELQFGTEIIATADGSLAALLGASPGASTSVSIMLDLLQKCFPEDMETEEWKNIIQMMIPTYCQVLFNDNQLCEITRQRTNAILKLEEIE